MFSANLLIESDLADCTIDKGAAVVSPFGVGYMLANINTKSWDVSNNGFEDFLMIPKEEIPDRYADMVQKLNKINVITKSVLYIGDENSTWAVPTDSQKLKTELIYTDYVSDWKTSRKSMNEMISKNTAGKITQLPFSKENKKNGGAGAINPFTVGIYLNTNHFKSGWKQNWTSIGIKMFFDGTFVPFYQLEGTYSTLNSETVTAVVIKLPKQKIDVVFVLPKGELQEFIQNDLANHFKGVAPLLWMIPKEKRKIQIPGFNKTLLSQHHRKLKNLGINDTFSFSTASYLKAHLENPNAKDEIISTRPFFADPIEQMNHVEFAPDFFQVASVTGTIINSTEKWVEHVTIDTDKPNDNISTETEKSAVNIDHVECSSEVEKKVQKINTSTSAKELKAIRAILEEDTIRFDRPFFWYLYDRELGPLYYGTVYSVK